MPFDQTNYQPEPIGRQRLRILADFLPSVPEDRFNMGSWAVDSVPQADLKCGTAACACGWATAEPRLHRAGLHLIPGDEMEADAEIGFGERTGWRAISAFFEIDVDRACHLFDGDEYVDAPSPSDVADRIREHLAQTADASSAVRAA